MRKIMIVLMCIGFLVSWQICQSDLANAGSKGRKCSLAGTWIVEAEGYDPHFFTYIPLDPWGKRYAVITEAPEPKVPDYISPNAERATNIYGTVVRVGKNLFKFSGYQFGVDVNGNKVWDIEFSVLTKFIDCDHIVNSISNTWSSDYYPGGCYKGTSKGTRLEMFEPCSDYPEFPE